MMVGMASNEAADQPRRASVPRASGEPAVPERSQDDTDVGWGERPEPDDDERYRQDRPPHWDSV